MHILFVDESGTAPPPDKASATPLFVLGGLVVPEEVWPKLKADLEAAKRRHKVTGEIKWRYFAPPKGGKTHSLSHLERDERDALREELLDAVARYKAIRIIAAVVDTVATYQRRGIEDADDLYQFAFKQLSERFQYFLQDLERESGSPMRGMIVCDNRNNDQDNRLKEFHQTLLQGGAFTSNYGNLIEGLFIAASHHSPGTQFADLVAGCVYRKESAGDTRFFDRIADRVRRSRTGAMAGYGLIYIPKK
ncbi:DUF3800 domain-containing protein [Microbacterium arborescens]|uniref:DUF3800 domain-containing protein n=1 Tax=Microbacterium arborescens TaxID=33883 RepID=UPI00259FEF02|nr:DUF3800 domain-containing protein [Microbacterium arborescens]WJM16030.1 DUF3800 domain-containing protein [Microbacterium arborescens]